MRIESVEYKVYKYDELTDDARELCGGNEYEFLEDGSLWVL